MAVEASVVESLRAKFESVLPQLDGRRWALGRADTVATLLHEQGFSLQANAKTIEGAQHPDRDAQFGYLNDQAAEHLAAGSR